MSVDNYLDKIISLITHKISNNNNSPILFPCKYMLFHQAKSYCKNCDDFICDKCIQKHDKSHTILKKNSTNHGVVFIKPGLNSYNPYLEFKVIITIPCKNKSHLFLGLVDYTKYTKPFLLSTFWKDSPSSFYWDVWNGKLVKNDENGNQNCCKIKYGCNFEDYETKFAFEYNQEKRTLAFYKNDIYLGVAFNNVPPGLTPAFEIWFETGIIKISDKSEPLEKVYL